MVRVKYYKYKLEYSNLYTMDNLILDFYLSGDMNVALYDENNNTTLSQFLSNNGVNVTNYDGHISSLLQLNQPKGTIAAININFKDIKDLEFTLQFNASYEHAAPIIVNLVDRYLSS